MTVQCEHILLILRGFVHGSLHQAGRWQVSNGLNLLFFSFNRLLTGKCIVLPKPIPISH